LAEFERVKSDEFSHHSGRNVFLAFCGENVYHGTMKFALAILVYLLMAAVLGAGILLLVAGKPWLFIVAFIVFVVAFGRLGCMTH
jgi:hypothetical protein